MAKGFSEEKHIIIIPEIAVKGKGRDSLKKIKKMSLILCLHYIRLSNDIMR
tara:strand:+ start:249 stop:401 length:153 start_codon:yes stop_codon:yes gene_type:complete